jgi:hypothetical protein
MNRYFLLLVTALSLICTSAGAASPSGAWKGRWFSQPTGHKGPLRAHIRPIDHDTYKAVFVGRFFVVVPFLYPATLERVPGTCNQYTSSQRLPLIGTYRMDATITPQRFHARFKSADDTGTFEMTRTR